MSIGRKGWGLLAAIEHQWAASTTWRHDMLGALGALVFILGAIGAIALTEGLVITAWRWLTS